MTAKKLGVSRQYVSNIRAGRQVPSVKICERLAEIVGVNPLEIIASCEVEKDPAERVRWEKWLGAAAILACAVFVNSPLESMAYEYLAIDEIIHYAQLAVGAALGILVYKWFRTTSYTRG